MVNLSDAQLISLLAKGSAEAFTEICTRYTRRIYAYCYRYVRSGLDTEELVQDVLLGLWNYRYRLTPASPLESLLLTIARRRCIDRVRTMVNSPVYEDYVNYRDSVAADVVNPLEYEEYMLRVKKALQSLPVPQRKVIELSKIHHLSNPEIASRLGLSEKTVRNRLSLGLRRMRQDLANISATVAVILTLGLQILQI